MAQWGPSAPSPDLLGQILWPGWHSGSCGPRPCHTRLWEGLLQGVRASHPTQAHRGRTHAQLDAAAAQPGLAASGRGSYARFRPAAQPHRLPMLGPTQVLRAV